MLPRIELRFRRQLFRDIRYFVIFSAALISLLLFFFVNIFYLPLGTINVRGSIEHSYSLEGADIVVFGEVQKHNETEFLLIDVSDGSNISAIWLGQGFLPVNGTLIAASGQLIPDSNNPLLICEDIDTNTNDLAIYESPWSLPVVRIFAACVFWFLALFTLTVALAVLFLIRENILLGTRMRAFSEITIFAGIISIVLLFFLSLIEPELIAPLSTSSFAVIISLGLLILSVFMRGSEETEARELADSVPIFAWISIMIGIPLTMLHIEAFNPDFLTRIMSDHLLYFSVPFALGLAGFILLSVYIAGRKYDIIGAKTILSYIRAGVNRYEPRG